MATFKLWKLGVTVLIFLFLALASVVIALNVAVYGGGRFYSSLPLYAAGSAFAVFVLWIFGMFSLKSRSTISVLVLVVFGATVTGYEMNRSYTNSFARIADNEVDLRKYEPFMGSKYIAKLPKPSSLSIHGDLPKLDGATALYPVYSSFVEATYPAGQYPFNEGSVVCSTTSRAFENLIDGSADVIFCAQPSKKQIDEAYKKGISFQLTPIGREAFVFFDNVRNPVSSVTSEQIKGIYSGKVRNWKELGGTSTEIKAFQRPENSGSQTILERIMVGLAIASPPKEDLIEGMGGIIEETAAYRNYPDSIGYSFLFFATEMVKENQIKLLRIDGVEPSKLSISDGTYPYSYDFYAITTERRSKNAQVLIDWILSEEGQLLVETSGYTRLAK